LWVRNIPIECEGCKWIYERSYFWTVEKDMNLWLFIDLWLEEHCTGIAEVMGSNPVQAWINFATA